MTQTRTTTRTRSATVWVTDTYEGLHWWAAAPPATDFLAAPHRHLFHVRVEVNVPIDDKRSVEFFELQGVLRGWTETATTMSLTEQMSNLGSCESQADAIAEYLIDRGFDVASVTVSEDGENGATVTLGAPE